jgi:hypothetical protein
MTKNILLSLAFTIGIISSSFSQSDAEMQMDAFETLVGGTWKAEGKWLKGNPFRQEVTFEWSLDHNIIRVKTSSYLDEEGEEFGLRSEGIRAWDSKDNSPKFWEFDVFGEVTTGSCIIEDNGNIHYQYEYVLDGSTSIFRDSWTKLNENTYRYKAGIYEGGKWKSVYLDTTFKREE